MLLPAPPKRSARIYPSFGASFGAAVFLVCGLGVLPPRARAETAPEVVVDPGRIWAFSPEEKLVEHAIRFEGRVSYIDGRWRNLWLEHDHRGEYIRLSESPPALRQGQRVLIEGTLLPREGLEASRVRVRVLAEDEPVEPLEATDRIFERETFFSRVVAVRAYVDAQQLIDDVHLKLTLVVADQPVTAWVRPDDPRAVPNWQGQFIELKGLYQARFDPSATQLTIELWTARQSDVHVLGVAPLAERFNRPAVPIAQIPRMPSGAEVKIRGRVQRDARGASLAVRDATGQILADLALEPRLAPGTEVELVGTPVLTAARWRLRSAFHRVVGPPIVTDSGELNSVERIRQLSLEEAARGLPVEITGVVTWSSASSRIFFLQDLTGGIRVRFNAATMETPARNKYLRLEGVTYDGGFAPAVEVRRAYDLGAMETPPTREVSYGRAITGQEDGQMVEMRGFFQRTDSDGTIRLIHVATPAGEFVGRLDSPVNFAPTVGSLVRIRGACEVQVDESGRIVGILLRMASLASASVEADAPADFFDLPVRSIRSLRQLGAGGELLRVRVQGVVLHAQPGRFVYLQQGDVGMLALTREKTVFRPGDVIDAVGLLGRQGVRTELRETVGLLQRSGPPPTPVPVGDPSLLTPGLDSRLVRLRGTLIDVVNGEAQTQLTLQSGGNLFEAILEGEERRLPAAALRPGAGLELTGIYRLRFDDSRQSQSFQVQLRSPADVAVYRPAKLWTVSRALAVAGVLSGCTLLGLAWVVALRRRVRRQTAQIRAQLERQARLEAELQRTARLESLGVLAGGIAHDFNNVLTVVMANLGLVLAEEKLSAESAAQLQEIARAAARARRLTRQLLTFAKGGDPILTPVALEPVVRAAFDVVLRSSPVHGEIAGPLDLSAVAADRDQLAQVIQNLALNAVQAMPEGGSLRATLAAETIKPDDHRGLAPGDYVKLTLADTGHGISAEALPRIFEPYYSTRETGRGLGLALVYSIINKHRGRIEVESTVGRGTTFHLWLPASSRPASGSESPFPSRAKSVANSPELSAAPAVRVLFMDDEESIRLIGAIALRRAGFDVVTATEGREALQHFEAACAEGRPFGLLILDLTTPGGLGGRETIQRIRALDAAVPAIVSSGYSSDPVMANFRDHGFQASVPKPYEIGVLLEAIEQVLGRTPRA